MGNTEIRVDPAYEAAERMLNSYSTPAKAREMAMLHAESYDHRHWKFAYWRKVARRIVEIGVED